MAIFALLEAWSSLWGSMTNLEYHLMHGGHCNARDAKWRYTRKVSGARSCMHMVIQCAVNMHAIYWNGLGMHCPFPKHATFVYLSSVAHAMCGACIMCRFDYIRIRSDFRVIV